MTAPHGTDGRPVTDPYDAALFDLDGVLYLQEDPIPHAADGVAAARAAGLRIGFVTNNASRRPDAVAALLTAVGVEASVDEIVTAAQASAAALADVLPPGSPVLVVGGPALAAEVADVGLRPVTSADEQPLAVVQGYAPEVDWRQLAEGCVAIRNGARWVATNGDLTVPSSRGPLPGNGALVAALGIALDRAPDQVVGKPHPRLHQESVRRTGARRPLVVGDRLDTDVAGAVAGEADSLLVLTGVATPRDVLRAPADARPTYLATDLRDLAVPHPDVDVADGTAACREWMVRGGDGALTLSGDGEPLDALRALAGAAWTSGGADVDAEGPAAARALVALGLAAR